jgi:hypothetical protein
MKLPGFLVFVMTATLATSSALAQGLTGGLAGYWPFDGNGGDLSGNGRDLGFNGGPSFGQGLFDQALSFSGVLDQYATRPVDDAEFNFGANDFTIQTWVNLNHRRPQIFIEKFFGQQGPGWTFYDTSNSIQFYADSAAIFITVSPSISLGDWHQLCARRSGNQFSIILDGQVVQTLASDHTIQPTSSPLWLGQRGRGEGGNYGLDGRIDEVAIWNRALSQEELAELYNSRAGKRIGDLLPKTVTVDISFPNSINPRSKGKTPVAILSTEGFDATTVVVNSVRFGLTGTEAAPLMSSVEDVDGDGRTDLQLHFSTNALGIVCGSVSGKLTGKTASGGSIIGSGELKTVGCK